MEASDYRNKYSIYKPNKTGSGAAVQFDFNKDKRCVFVEAAKQTTPPAGSTAPHAFDWGNKLVFKLASTDLGKILTVLEGRLKSVDLFHDPSKGGYTLAAETKNSTVSLAKGDYGFFLKVSSQARDGSVQAINLGVSEDEAAVLRILLAKAVESMYCW
ncbi:hypothetical protein H0O03_02895 [Candidatus Micrarchaeota archaeon]|nr:hypothetical protein [Candidatus Micrarchaeota archaeon]